MPSQAIFASATLPFLADLLLAFAHADNRLDGREVQAVRTLLGKQLKADDELPEELASRIDAFDIKTFDLDATVKGLGTLTKEHKRAVLEMLSEVGESDDEIDFAEDEFLRKVGDAIGASAEELKGLLVEIVFELPPAKKRPAPPPLPKK